MNSPWQACCCRLMLGLCCSCLHPLLYLSPHLFPPSLDAAVLLFGFNRICPLFESSAHDVLQAGLVCDVLFLQYIQFLMAHLGEVADKE